MIGVLLLIIIISSIIARGDALGEVGVRLRCSDCTQQGPRPEPEFIVAGKSISGNF